MKVAIYHSNSDIRIEERAIPKISDDEILVKAKFCGICGTDVMEWYRTKKGPRLLGHEMAGEIIESKNKNYPVGKRVFVSHHVPCNACKYCLSGNHTACDALHKGNFDPGGFSEYIRVPKENADLGTYILPDEISYEEATMIEPLACVINGQKIVDVKPRHTILVLGSGISGLLHIQLAKNKGAKVIATDIDEHRLDKAKEFGADKVIDAKGEIDVKADRIIICAGSLSAYEQAFRCIDKAGKILAFAVPSRNIEIPSLDFWRNELSIASTYGASPDDLAESLELIRKNKINVKDMITHKVKLEDIQHGFDLVANPKDNLKVLVEF